MSSADALVREVEALGSLERVLGWMQARGLSLAETDLVAQDEFCHDLLVPLPDGRWLGIGLT